MDWGLFLSTFALIFVAEIPDKTALATVMMATRGSGWPIFVGVALAFLVQSLVAVTFGGVFALLPQTWVQAGAGLMFLAFAGMALRGGDEGETAGEAADAVTAAGAKPSAFWRTVWSSFLVIFIAEWGDITQLMTASITARSRQPLIVFFAATSALWLTTALAIVVGQRLKSLVRPPLLRRLSAVGFALVGLYFLISAWGHE